MPHDLETILGASSVKGRTKHGYLQVHSNTAGTSTTKPIQAATTSVGAPVAVVAAKQVAVASPSKEDWSCPKCDCHVRQ